MFLKRSFPGLAMQTHHTTKQEPTTPRHRELITGEITELISRLEVAQSPDHPLYEEASQALRNILHTLYPTDDLIVDLDRNVARRGNLLVTLSPSQTVILYQLANSGAPVTPVTDLKRAVYGAAHRNKSDTTLRVHIGNLNDRILPLNLSIRNHFNRGYSIEPIGPLHVP
jgi:DNA-binding response OmpR family regulator